MKKDMIDILCCPVCKGDLRLTITKEEDEEIITGSFTCSSCNVTYPIEEGIPNLLPQDDDA